MQADTRQQLSEALTRGHEDYARMVLDRMTRIEQYPTPFFNRYSIYQVEHLSPRKPIVFFVGFAPGEQVYLLTGQPENFVRLAYADGVSITSPEVAVSYTTAYLETTRSMSRLTYLVKSTSDVRFRPNLADEEASSKDSFLEKYRTIITPPLATPEGDGFRVNVFVVREQALEQHSIKVERDGSIQDHVTTLEQHLPLVYGL